MRYCSTTLDLEYIEIPKAACSSIKAALLLADGLDEFAVGNRMHLDTPWKGRFHGFTAKKVFTFVRHPFARLESSFVDKLQGDRAKKLVGACPLSPNSTFEEWVNWVTMQDPMTCDKHWRPQVNLINRWKSQFPGENVNSVGKLEFIEIKWPLVHPDIPHLPFINEGRPRNMTWTPKAYRYAKEYYAEDLETYGYPTYPPSPGKEECLSIQGWSTEAELSTLQEICKGANVLEVGIWKGRSTVGIAATAKRVLSIDHFYGDRYTGHASTGPETIKYLLNSPARERVSVLIGSWKELIPTLNLSHFNVAFYDADHTYKATKDFLTIAASIPVIAIHDYDNNPNHTGVKAAVLEFQQLHKKSLTVTDTLAVLR